MKCFVLKDKCRALDVTNLFNMNVTPKLSILEADFDQAFFLMEAEMGKQSMCRSHICLDRTNETGMGEMFSFIFRQDNF